MLPRAERTKEYEQLKEASGKDVLTQEFTIDTFEEPGLRDIVWLLPRNDRSRQEVHTYGDSGRGYAGFSFHGSSSSGTSSIEKALFGIEDEELDERLLEGDLDHQASQEPFLVRSYGNQAYDVAERTFEIPISEDKRFEVYVEAHREEREKDRFELQAFYDSEEQFRLSVHRAEREQTAQIGRPEKQQGLGWTYITEEL